MKRSFLGLAIGIATLNLISGVDPVQASIKDKFKKNESNISQCNRSTAQFFTTATWNENTSKYYCIVGKNKDEILVFDWVEKEFCSYGTCNGIGRLGEITEFEYNLNQPKNETYQDTLNSYGTYTTEISIEDNELIKYTCKLDQSYECNNPKRMIIGYPNKNSSNNVNSSIRNSSSNQKSAKNYFESGRKKRDSEDFKGAIKDFDKAIQMNKNYDKAYYYRALSKSQAKDYQGAINDYTKAIEFLPNFPDAYYLRGYLYLVLADGKDRDLFKKGCISIKQADVLGSKEAKQLIKDGTCNGYI